MRVLVCGSRDWTNKDLIYQELDKIAPTEIVEGCARGADQLAEQYAREHRIYLMHFPANWSQLGRAAGPIRNKEMLETNPDLVVAFSHHTAGTDNMIKQATDKGVSTLIFYE